MDQEILIQVVENLANVTTLSCRMIRELIEKNKQLTVDAKLNDAINNYLTQDNSAHIAVLNTRISKLEQIINILSPSQSTGAPFDEPDTFNPEESKCLVCGNPVKPGRKVCSNKCRGEFASKTRELKKLKKLPDLPKPEPEPGILPENPKQPAQQPEANHKTESGN